MTSKMSISEMITYSTVLINCEYANGTSGRGTGFIINLCHNKEDYTFYPALVTNNHVVENSIRTEFQFCQADEEGKPIDTKPYTIDYKGNSWIHHPDPTVDLCVLFLASILEEIDKKGDRIFYAPLETSLIPSRDVIDKLFAIEDVIMVGYPIGLSDEYNHKPIARRGITASHPKKDYQGKKEILLDMACYPGSSGSPVFILNQGAYSSLGGLTVGNRVYLLGVLYGGPQFNIKGTLQFGHLPNVPTPVMKIPTNLGIMIKSERILEFEDMIRSYQGGKTNGTDEV